MSRQNLVTGYEEDNPTSTDKRRLSRLEKDAEFLPHSTFGRSLSKTIAERVSGQEMFYVSPPHHDHPEALI